jgi:Domain of unknown function (DUF4157)
MGNEREYEPTPAAPEVAPPVKQTPEPVPAAPVPMAIGGLVVGHAEDRAEADADRMADNALSRLQRLSNDVHVHGPGCDHLRRITSPTAPSGAPVVGREGGALDVGTSSAIENARGSGRPMPGDLRRRMESAFSTNFAAVRIHDDGGAAKLNEAVSARAFTTGSDIFFGRGQFAPTTKSGERVLAHELAHVVQDSGRSVSRSLDPRAFAALERSVQVRRDFFSLPWRKTPEQKAKKAEDDKAKAAKKDEEAQAKALKKQQETEAKALKKQEDAEKAEIAASRKDGGATLGEFSDKLKKQKAQQDKAAAASRKDGASTLHDLAVAGKTKQVSEQRLANGVGRDPEDVTALDAQNKATFMEVAKPGGAVGVTGLAAAGTFLGHAVGPAREAASAAGAMAGSAASGALSPLLMGDTGMGAYDALITKRRDANEFDDDGMQNLWKRKAKDQGQAFLGASANTARAGVGLADKLGSAVGSATLGVAGGALGVGVGSAQVLQGAWRGGKAIMKLCRLAWGRASTMLSARGADWKKAIVSAERYKAGIAAMKVALGAIGIAAGALLIVSNPIGWAIGLAAAIAGGVYAGVKIAGKIQNARDRKAAAERIANGVAASDLFPDVGPDKALAGPGQKWAKSAKTGMAKEKAPKAADAEKRAKTIEQANQLAQEASANARLAAELRASLSAGDSEVVLSALHESNTKKGFDKATKIVNEDDRELHDGHLLLSSINVDTDEALSDSGQDLIEKKLSKAEAM